MLICVHPSPEFVERYTLLPAASNLLPSADEATAESEPKEFDAQALPEFVEAKTVPGPQATNVSPSAEDAIAIQRS